MMQPIKSISEKKQIHTSGFTNVPKFVLFNIVSFLNNPREAINLSLTCKDFYKLRKGENFWIPFIQRHFPASCIPTNIKPDLFIKNQICLTSNKILQHPQLKIEKSRKPENKLAQFKKFPKNSNHVEIYQEDSRTKLMCEAKGKILSFRECKEEGEAKTKYPLSFIREIKKTRIIASGIYGDILFMGINMFFPTRPPIITLVPVCMVALINRKDLSTIKILRIEREHIQNFEFTEDGTLHLELLKGRKIEHFFCELYGETKSSKRSSSK